jgi:hypothetical protein
MPVRRRRSVPPTEADVAIWVEDVRNFTDDLVMYCDDAVKILASRQRDEGEQRKLRFYAGVLCETRSFLKNSPVEKFMRDFREQAAKLHEYEYLTTTREGLRRGLLHRLHEAVLNEIDRVSPETSAEAAVGRVWSAFQGELQPSSPRRLVSSRGRFDSRKDPTPQRYRNPEKLQLLRSWLLKVASKPKERENVSDLAMELVDLKKDALTDAKGIFRTQVRKKSDSRRT